MASLSQQKASRPWFLHAQVSTWQECFVWVGSHIFLRWLPTCALHATSGKPHQVQISSMPPQQLPGDLIGQDPILLFGAPLFQISSRELWSHPWTWGSQDSVLSSSPSLRTYAFLGLPLTDLAPHQMSARNPRYRLRLTTYA